MKAKKVLAILMASAMIMGTSVTAFAEVPKESDSTSVIENILGVEEKATITAYQIIDAEYTDDGFVGYKWVAGDKSGEDVTFDEVAGKDVVVGLTDDYITDLASNPRGLDGLNKKNPRTEQLEVGTWMLLVTGSGLDKVYNPMIISVNYKVSGSDNSIESGTVDASKNWTLETTDAYAKSSEVSVKKEADDKDGKGDKDNVEVGDTVEYTITTTIPSYSADSVANFIVSDEITNGLSYELPEEESVIEPTVFIGDTEIEPVDPETQQVRYTVEMTHQNGKNGFKVIFDSAYIKTLAAPTQKRDVKITYSATVTEDAITGAGVNTVKVDYDQGSKTDTEYVYSVSFDGVVKKIGDKNPEGLAGAEFTLYDTWTDAGEQNGQKEADELSGQVGNPYKTVSTNDYEIVFKGLDADKEYYLTETAAPKGYTINNTVYTITFSNVMKNNGAITYNVLVDGEIVGSVSAYNEPGQPVDDEVFKIQNTSLSSLPSTGGIGTTIFTIGGCAIMVTAAGLYFATRKKTEK